MLPFMRPSLCPLLKAVFRSRYLGGMTPQVPCKLGYNKSAMSRRISRRCYSASSSDPTTMKYPLTKHTEEQEALREMVQKFTANVITPVVKIMETEKAILPSVIGSLFAHGFMGIEIPVEYGGSGMSFTDCVIVIEEIARADPAVAALVDIHNTLINRLLLSYGTDEQKEQYLPMCAQEAIGSFCISESSSGSDAFALQTKATKVDGGWELNGTKQWVSNAAEAGVFFVFATVDPAKRHRGISCFIVEKDTEGFEIGSQYEKMGIRASSTCEVTLSDVFVPENRVLGRIGEGYKMAIDSLNEGRIGIAAQMLGLAEGAFAVTLPYLFERKQFGSFIGDFQGVRFQFAEMATNLQLARLAVYNCAALKENGYNFTKEAAMAKLVTARIAQSVASECLNLFGGNGFTTEYPIEKYFRDAKIGAIYEGTNNIQLETIAKLVKKEHFGE